MIEMMIMMSIIFLVQMTKAATTRWLQMTLTEGNQKGAVDWLQAGVSINPGTIYYGTAKQFEDDGYNIPLIPIAGEKSSSEFLMHTAMCILILDKLDTVRRPLLVYQKTARDAWTKWMTDQPWDDLGMDKKSGLQGFRMDEDVDVHFVKIGKKKFDGFKLKIVDTSPFTEDA